jgi:hypothetical protein
MRGWKFKGWKQAAVNSEEWAMSLRRPRFLADRKAKQGVTK